METGPFDENLESQIESNKRENVNYAERKRVERK